MMQVEPVKSKTKKNHSFSIQRAFDLPVDNLCQSRVVLAVRHRPFVLCYQLLLRAIRGTDLAYGGQDCGRGGKGGDGEGFAGSAPTVQCARYAMSGTVIGIMLCYAMRMLSCYASVVHCPVLQWYIVLRICCAMSSTARSYGTSCYAFGMPYPALRSANSAPCYALRRCPVLRKRMLLLRVGYAMPGTEIAYDATRPNW
eukprot:1813766-Rhodomonas_salina.3